MSISLGNCQFRIEPEEKRLFGIKGQSLTMQWNMVNKNASYFGIDLYLGEKVNPNRVLYSSNTEVKVIDHFGNRSKVMRSSNAFKLQINNLQYSDQASYLLRVVLSDPGVSKDNAIITIANITGKHGII